MDLESILTNLHVYTLTINDSKCKKSLKEYPQHSTVWWALKDYKPTKKARKVSFIFVDLSKVLAFGKKEFRELIEKSEKYAWADIVEFLEIPNIEINNYYSIFNFNFDLCVASLAVGIAYPYYPKYKSEIEFTQILDKRDAKVCIKIKETTVNIQEKE